MQASAQVLEATRRVPELGEWSERLGVDWSLVGVEETDGGATVQRGEKVLIKTKMSGWSEQLKDFIRMLHEQGIEERLTKSSGR